MSIYRTDGQTTDPATGIPVLTGLLLVTVSGLRYSTVPVGEAPGGLNSTPGMISAQLLTGIANTGWNQPLPGVPYGFSAPIYIGPTS